jgi:acetoacetyl-CoA synthetase
MGVVPGDRVAAYLPNIAETVIVFLASASLGAIFVSCAPEFGVDAVVNRLAQISPKILFVIDGYRFGSKVVDRVGDVASIRAALTTLEETVVIPYFDDERAAAIPDTRDWSWVMDADPDFRIAELAFDHPLYILFSSGSTGPPKAIVHAHGGITIEHLKWLAVHSDVAPGDVFYWPSSTAWMTWNIGVSALLCGARIVLFDGDPTQPDLDAYWKLAGERMATHVGVSPPLLSAARRAGVVPAEIADLSRVRVISSGGSPLSADLYDWVYDSIGTNLMLASVSGGTDCCTAFVGGSPLLPVRGGEITCRFLGTKVEAFNEEGLSVVGEQAELVITEPMPSMPTGFWGDHDESRLRAAYFERFPGVWCHGDWITISDHGTVVITGRSDATLNRGGVRLGTQEFYAAIDDLPELSDSLVVHLEDSEGELGELLLFVSLVKGAQLDLRLRDKIKGAIQKRLSPRFVPDEILVVPIIPRTITGKRLEVPIKRALNGVPLKSDVGASLADPDSLNPFLELAKSRRTASGITQ